MVSTPTEKEINEIRDLLKEILAHLNSFIEKDYPELGHPAFVDMDKEFRPDMFRILEERFNEADSYIKERARNEVFLVSMGNVGFSGKELTLKQKALKKAKEIYEKLRTKGKEIWRKFAPVFLDFIDDILDSLAKAIPVLEAVAEIKKYFKNSINAAIATS